MKKKMYQDEELLRDKLLRHEFEADEQDWDKMNALLHGVPAPAQSPLPIPSGASSMLGSIAKWALLVAGVGLAAFLGVWAGKNWIPQSPAMQVATQAATPASAGLASAGSLITPTTGSTVQAPVAQHWTQAEGKAQKSPAEHRAVEMAGSGVGFSPLSPTDSWVRGDAPARIVAAALPAAFIPSSTPASQVEGGFSGINTESRAALPPSEGADAGVEKGVAQAATTSPTLPQSPTSDAKALLPLGTPWHSALTVPLPRPDVMPHANVASLIDRFQKQGSKRWQAGVLVGGQWAIVNQSINKVTLVPLAGLTLNAKISRRWWAEAALTYRQVRGFDVSANWESRGFNLDGKLSNWSATTSTKRMDFVEVPLLIKYAMPNGDQRLMLGVRGGRIFPKSTQSSYFHTAGISPAANVAAPDIRDGLRRFDLAFTVGVEARVRPNVWLDIRHTQGLLDLTYDNFFGNTRTDRTTDTQLTLRYYFLSF